MAESSFNRKFRAAMAARGIKIYRVESHATSPGIPDNYFIIPGLGGHSGWIEMKESTEARPSKIEYQPAQVPWIEQHTRDGGICWTVLHIVPSACVVIVRGEDAKHAAKDLWASRYEACTLDRFEICWDFLASVLQRKA